MEKAPFFDHLAEGPENGAAWWLRTSDDVRIRITVWPCKGARGTVLLFPGRTEYGEKYGRAAVDLAARGYATLAIDWRCQGLADRLLDDPTVGHVGSFADYQRDVAAVIEGVQTLDLPRPFHLIAHSLGGCIGLRAVMNGLPVNSCVFSAPMWGIIISPVQRPVAWALGWSASHLQLGNTMAPGTSPVHLVTSAPFQGNPLTTDPDMFDYMKRHLDAQPALSLGGPSIRWVHKALVEMRALAHLPAPDLPCLAFLGTSEQIVDAGRIKARMDSWPNGELVMLDGAEHEVMMEVPAIRNQVFDRATALFDANAKARPGTAVA
ncbi:alpha/beta hydrolase [Lutimaribacter sp. EGI FJ00015]|uniref:Alpha/beta hydrolase n=1 Tax=Lutimaribacter degradans TaxID=2945989 RepID=A0ACC5ZST0_9RHOB|nr:alpha/beta hydrolase [Lutimaribacter sp. EGI FJ00013]MCM2561394.1 alpha/beta hydrolase [Lutimaribacter sp. EGI FJ00013]MCO0612896.1 alpha/beta hydrolase [Lutimaribacter sp. EGI FJ00015]MCO0635554.1 alpha/beta hydrolase [Lutimaribacter sp. EGI FJ00014]